MEFIDKLTAKNNYYGNLGEKEIWAENFQF